MGGEALGEAGNDVVGEGVGEVVGEVVGKTPLWGGGCTKGTSRSAIGPAGAPAPGSANWFGSWAAVSLKNTASISSKGTGTRQNGVRPGGRARGAGPRARLRAPKRRALSSNQMPSLAAGSPEARAAEPGAAISRPAAARLAFCGCGGRLLASAAVRRAMRISAARAAAR